MSSELRWLQNALELDPLSSPVNLVNAACQVLCEAGGLLSERTEALTQHRLGFEVLMSP